MTPHNAHGHPRGTMIRSGTIPIIAVRQADLVDCPSGSMRTMAMLLDWYLHLPDAVVAESGPFVK
jgi:hypothetical protein